MSIHKQGAAHELRAAFDRMADAYEDVGRVEIREDAAALARAAIILFPDARADFEPLIRSLDDLAQAERSGARSTRYDRVSDAVDDQMKRARKAFAALEERYGSGTSPSVVPLAPSSAAEYEPKEVSAKLAIFAAVLADADADVRVPLDVPAELLETWATARHMAVLARAVEAAGLKVDRERAARVFLEGTARSIEDAVGGSSSDWLFARDAMRTTLRARYTGDRQVCYRWLGMVGGGKLVPAQEYPGAFIVGIDTFPERPDGRVKTSTVIAVPSGLLLIERAHDGRGITNAAAILRPGRGPASVDWSAARHIRYVAREPLNPLAPNGETVAVHYVDVDGVEGRYVTR